MWCSSARSSSQRFAQATAARNRTHDKDEIRFLTIALTDLATIKVR
jgi:hypothetical protein